MVLLANSSMLLIVSIAREFTSYTLCVSIMLISSSTIFTLAVSKEPCSISPKLLASLVHNHRKTHNSQQVYKLAQE